MVSGVTGSMEGTGLMVATEAVPLVLTTTEVGSIPTAVPNEAAEATNEQTPTTITFIPYADGEIKVNIARTKSFEFIKHSSQSN